MSIATSTFPKHYDLQFIITKAGVVNHYGHEIAEEEIIFRYPVENIDAVAEIVESYPVAYREVMVPAMINHVSFVRARKIATFTFGGMTIPLNDKTQADLTGAALGLTLDPEVLTLNWSLGNGASVTLDRDTVLAMAKAAFRHVQDCFTAQKTINEAIKAAADIEELALIDVANHEAWPT